MKSKKLNQYYTAPHIVKQVLQVIEQHNLINNKSVFVEPAAGDGKFIDQLINKYPNEIIAYDIDKKHHQVIKQDYLTTNINYSEHNITIGNPPFGKRSDLAIKFFNHSTKHSDIICFIVPVQFKRWNVQKQLNKDFKLIYCSDDLPKKSFLLDNRPVSINCCIQIWIHKNKTTLKDLRIQTPPANTHEDFIIYTYNNTPDTIKYFLKDEYKWDFAVVRQGYYNYEEKIYDPKDLKTNRQYVFFKYISNDAEENLHKIDFSKLSNSNTTIKGFSNTDIVREYKKIKKF